ncbi:hypothetical protein, partial [Mesorhizobium sp. M7D.F.Ca.US.004.03.1.1]|uniref:hypothetical protein n=1 Tax=Mesorhizobium sp. M7D.F.Ca.US.004.03.1.1 TaxID=2496702 RepID=UPI0019D2E818
MYKLGAKPRQMALHCGIACLAYVSKGVAAAERLPFDPEASLYDRRIHLETATIVSRCCRTRKSFKPALLMR